MHTGDIGLILPNGALKIIDRKKNIFKLNQGEYIAPYKLEEAYQSIDLIQQVFIYGDSLQPHIVAIIVPDPEFLEAFMTDQEVADTDVDEYINSEAFHSELTKRIIQVRRDKQVSLIMSSSTALKCQRSYSARWRSSQWRMG